MASLASSVAFPKRARLLTSEQYSFVFDSVDFRASSKNFLMLTRKQLENEANACKNVSDDSSIARSRLGIIVAKKHVRHAVQRNRIKRLLRESFRHKRDKLPPVDVVVLAKKGADQLDNERCLAELQHLWSKLLRKIGNPKH